MRLLSYFLLLMTPPSARDHPYLPLSVSLIIGGLLTAITTLMVGNWELKSAQHQFEEQADHLSQHLQSHLDQYTQVTNALGIFYKASDNVTREDFHTFARPWLKKYPEILGITWVKRVPAAERSVYEQAMKAEGLTQFKIHGENWQPIGQKSEYFPITYGEPPHIYQSYLGFDVGERDFLRPFLDKARDSGEIVATHTLPLLTGKNGFALFNPIYRPGTSLTTTRERQREFMGVVTTVYQLKNLLEKTLKDIPHYQLSFYLLDTSAKANNRLLLTFDGKTRTLSTPDQTQASYVVPLICKRLVDCERSLKVADHQWTLMIIPDVNLARLLLSSGIILLLGFSLTGLLVMYLWQTLAEKAHIEKLVTERTAELRQAKDELEIRVQERTAELQAANESKNELLSQIGHEFRTPLTIILGFIDLLDRDRTLNPQQQENLAIMRRSGEYLLSLFAEILEISRLETHKNALNLTSVNLHSLVNSVMEIVGIKAQGKNLPVVAYIAPELPQYIKIDENKVRQILINLLDNAIKFTDEGLISLRIISEDPEMISQSSPQITFEVQDTGSGISPEIQAKVFEPFVRGSTGKGAGLGLSIAQKLVQLMEGEITLVSPVQDQKGTLIRFHLPLMVPESTDVPQLEPIQQIIGLAPNQPAYRLLVMENQAENGQLLTQLLTSLGFQVQAASSPEQVIEICYDWRPHLIIIDTQISCKDGYQFLQPIKRELIHPHPTIIIGLTTYDGDFRTRSALASVCDETLRQPFDTERLLQKIGSYLGISYEYEICQSLPLDQESIELTLQPSSLEVMPLEWINAVYQAASEGNSQELYQLIEKIPPIINLFWLP